MSFDKQVYATFYCELAEVMKKISKKDYSDIVFMCIGSKNIVGDSLGPKVGQILKSNLKNKKIKVVGDVSNNINNINIEEKIRLVKENLLNPYIISLDSAMSRNITPGKVFLIKKGIVLGSALNKKTEEVGNISIKAIVAKDEKNFIKNYYNLRSVNENFILGFSKNISKIILNSINFLDL